MQLEPDKQHSSCRRPRDMNRRMTTLGLLTLLAGCAAKPPDSSGGWVTRTIRRPRPSATPRRSAMSSAKTPAGPPPRLGTLQLGDDLRDAAVAYAKLLMNTPYSWGGNTPEGGFDCSGLVFYVVERVTRGGRQLPRTTAQWAAASTPIQDRHRQPGDLVFFNTSGKPFSHMGIYVGRGRFIHAPSSGGVVHQTALSNRYFQPRYLGTHRIFFA